ncbi:AMP-binding protein, partial [Streptomyces sodiiphilus]|uniref:AMP-binding protein n=1 Tax=Streptomyces sodiiphilus TaxID=226217 RepID=UPI0031DE099D
MAGERGGLLGVGRGGDVVVSGGVAEVFGGWVERCPDAVALVCGGREWSFAEVDRVSDVWAGRLVEAGVVCGSAVGVLMERSAELLVLLLAVVKAGGMYVPLGVGDPVSRLRGVLGECGASVLVVGGDVVGHELAGSWCGGVVVAGDVWGVGGGGGFVGPVVDVDQG